MLRNPVCIIIIYKINFILSIKLITPLIGFPYFENVRVILAGKKEGLFFVTDG